MMVGGEQKIRSINEIYFLRYAPDRLGWQERDWRHKALQVCREDEELLLKEEIGYDILCHRFVAYFFETEDEFEKDGEVAGQLRSEIRLKAVLNTRHIQRMSYCHFFNSLLPR